MLPQDAPPGFPAEKIRWFIWRRGILIFHHYRSPKRNEKFGKVKSGALVKVNLDSEGYVFSIAFEYSKFFHVVDDILAFRIVQKLKILNSVEEWVE